MASNLSSSRSRASLDDHDEMLKEANETLKKQKGNREAQHTRAVALLKLERYDDALRTFEDSGDQVKKDAPLEYAYALYKNGQMEDAEKISGGARAPRNLKHMQAQASYRLENFAKARALYTELASRAGDEEGDLRINGGATDAQLAWAGHGSLVVKRKADREDMQQFETAFNAACGYIARGELKQASTLLTRARDLCNATDELSEEEKTTELLPILVQQIYVLSKLGQIEEATKLASRINVADINDQATKHVAQTNKLVLSSEGKNPFMSHRAFNLSSGVPNIERPFRFQSTILHRNSLALDLEFGKEPSRTTGHQSPSSLSPELASVGVIRAAGKARSQTGKIAIREIMPLLEKHPDDPGLLLTILHLYLLTNNTHMAATLLEKFFSRLEQSSASEGQDARFAPGLIALQVSLDSALNRASHTKQELAKAALYWRHRSKGKNGFNESSLFAAAGLALLDNPSPQDQITAREIFEHMSKQDPESKATIAGLTASSQESNGHFDLDSSLPSIAELTRGIEASALEVAGVVKAPKQTAIPTNRKRAIPDHGSKSLKLKKVRQSRMPEDYDPDKKVDHERWLPLRDRSNYRPKGKKKGKAAQVMASQGSLVSDESRPATPSQVVVQGKLGKGKKKGKK